MSVEGEKKLLEELRELNKSMKEISQALQFFVELNNEISKESD